MKVLFVEDDPMNRRVVKDMLAVAGIEMSEAEEAETGLAMVASEHFDLVLMDLRMPGMDGLTAIRQIRSRTDTLKAIPVIVVTADAALDIQERCLAAGADELLRKPVAMNLLFDAIGRVLAKADAPAAILA
jgi:CheY-like chemotaxis protein